MSVQRHPIPPKDADLETTAELPVLDVATYEAALTEERSGSTDTWHMPALAAQATAQAAAASATSSSAAVAAAEDRSLQLETDLRALSENLRDVEERLTRKGERLIEIERELANARAERIAIDERAAALVAAAEERVAATAAELSAVRAELAIERQRVSTLQASVEERDNVARSLQSRDQDLVSQLASRDRELALARDDVRALEVRTAHYLESLHTLESRRNIFDEQLLGLDGELESREAQLSQVQQQLDAQRARTQELTAEAASRQKRIEALEREVSSLAGSLGQRNVEVEQVARTTSKLQETVQSLTETLAARVERIKALESAAAAQGEAFTERGRKIDGIKHERDELSARCVALEASIAELKAARASQESAVAEAARARSALDAEVAHAQARIEALEGDLAVARAESAERASSMVRLEGERDGQINRLAASEARCVDLERRLDDDAEVIRQLQEELRAALTRGSELEGDLHAAEDAINRIEGELRTRSQKLEELTRTHEDWRGTIEEARNSLAERDSLIHRLETEAANSAMLLGNIQQSIKRLDPSQSGSHEIAPEGAVRLLIRVDGDTEVVHVLGRKTTVGRTPDNDLQIDAKFISRNHAVILAGPNHTIIEDLNSTNGVAVNGKRITRHTLADGDQLSIGKTSFRFAVRPAQERR